MTTTPRKLEFRKLSAFARAGNPLAVYPLKRVSRVVGLADVLARQLRTYVDDRTDAFEVVMSERIVEYPQVAMLVRASDRYVLDFGGYEGVLAMQFASLGYLTTIWDQRPYPLEHPNLSVVTADIFDDTSGPRRSFDFIYSVSTIEHLGLGHYGDKVVEDADRRALARLWGQLADGGRMVVTVPAGKAALHRGYRVYDEAAIGAAFPLVSEIRWFAKIGRQGAWLPVDASQACTIEYERPDRSRPCEAVAVVVCDKGGRS